VYAVNPIPVHSSTVAGALARCVASLREKPSMEPTDITIEILKSIRDELGGVRQELVGITGRMDRVERRQTEAELRVATEFVAVSGVVREMRDAYREERALSHRVDDHERRLSEMERRVGG